MSEFVYSIEEQNEWIARFEAQKNDIKAQLFEKEQIEQCCDTKSFDGRYYNPMWVVTSEARIWSLPSHRFLSPKRSVQGRRNRNGEYTATSRWYEKNNWHETVAHFGNKDMVQVYYHQIVANYFCDRKAIDLFGEENCIPHHIFRYRPLLDDGLVHTEQEDCTWNNRAKHLRWVSKHDHTILTYLQDVWNSRMNLDDAVNDLIKGIPYKDRYTGERTLVTLPGEPEELRLMLSDIFENAKFYRIKTDAEGNTIREDQWTALWYEYDGKKDGDVIAVNRKLTAKGFWVTEGLPYIK